MLTKEQINQAISDTLVERSSYINIDSVLVPFLTDLTRITISGFFTDEAFNSLIELINRDYPDLNNMDYTVNVDGSGDMIMDFLTLFYHNLCIATGKDNLDLNYLTALNNAVIDTKDLSEDYKQMFKSEPKGGFVNIAFLIRINVNKILNLVNYGEGKLI